MNLINDKLATKLTSELWSDSVVPVLTKYIEIPNKSPSFDPDWQKHGYMEDAVNLLFTWAQDHSVKGMTAEVVRLPNRTPVIFLEIQGTAPGTTLLYGHLDKQPEMEGWDPDLGPWKPVLRDDKLYGRGGADDGYSLFASLTSLAILQSQNIPHGRCVILIEACEESGSYDLPFYVDHLAPRIGSPDLVVCLDSGCGNYDQLWCTTSLRGMITGTLSAELIAEGVHSGDASGIVASSFRVLRNVLERLENGDTGELKEPSLYTQIPRSRILQASKVSDVLADMVWRQFPFHEGVKPISQDGAELILNRTWRPALAITGADGLPPIQNAGNVMRPKSQCKLSLRLPPTTDAEKALSTVKELLEKNPPYSAKVRFVDGEATSGWHAPEFSPWLEKAMNDASVQYFGKPAMHMGEGGSIPFMGMLGEKFPKAQFMISGVLGPGSNAHGPNEFLHIPTAKKLSACVAEVLARHAQR